MLFEKKEIKPELNEILSEVLIDGSLSGFETFPDDFAYYDLKPETNILIPDQKGIKKAIKKLRFGFSESTPLTSFFYIIFSDNLTLDKKITIFEGNNLL